MISILGVDPGYRNLAMVRIDFTAEKEVFNIHGAHIDIGPQSTPSGIINGIFNYISSVDIPKKFMTGLDYCVIEDQNIGPKTKSQNVGIAWLIAGIVKTHSPGCCLDLLSAKSKFALFKFDFPPPQKVLKTDKDSKRTTKIKNNSVYLAKELLKRGKSIEQDFFGLFPEDKWNHLADAIGLAFVRLEAC